MSSISESVIFMFELKFLPSGVLMVISIIVPSLKPSFAMTCRNEENLGWLLQNCSQADFIFISFNGLNPVMIKTFLSLNCNDYTTK